MGPHHVTPESDLEKLDGLTLERAEILFVHKLVSVGGDLVGAMFSSNGFESCRIGLGLGVGFDMVIA